MAISSSGRPLNDDKESQGSRSTRRRGRSPCGVPSPAALASCRPSAAAEAPERCAEECLRFMATSRVMPRLMRLGLAV